MVVRAQIRAKERLDQRKVSESRLEILKECSKASILVIAIASNMTDKTLKQDFTEVG